MATYNGSPSIDLEKEIDNLVRDIAIYHKTDKEGNEHFKKIIESVYMEVIDRQYMIALDELELPKQYRHGTLWHLFEVRQALYTILHNGVK